MDVFSHLYATATPARNTNIMSTTNPIAFDASSRILAEQILDDTSSSIDENDHGDLFSSSSSSSKPDLGHQTNVASIVGATAGGGSTYTEPLLDPLEDLRGYFFTAYVPPMPEESREEWVKMMNIIRAKRPSIKGKIRAVTNPAVAKPNSGRRTLVGVERIEIGDLKRHCDSWTNSRIPRQVDLESLHHVRPDLFLGFDEPEDDLIPEELALNPAQITWGMKAKNFNAYRAATPSSDGESEVSSSSTEVDSVRSLRIRRYDSPLSSTSAATSAEESTHARGERLESGSGAPSRDIPGVNEATSRLSSALRSTLFDTASSTLHVSEGRATRGWRWMDRQEAWDHALARKADVHGLTVNDVDPGTRSQGEIPFMSLDWMVWGKPGEVDPVNARDKGALGMLVIILPPWIFPQQSLSDFTSPQEYSDGVRGEPKFLPHEALLAAVYDLCRQLKVLHFTVATYTHLASGAFNKSYSIAFITEPVRANSPPPPSPSSTALNIGAGCRPNALRLLAYWMRCSMGSCEDAWPIPAERPVQSHLTHQDSEVARAAAKRIEKLLEEPDVSSAVRASESYGPLEESDFALVRTVQISQTLDIEHRKAHPRTIVVTQAVYAEDHQGLIQMEFAVRSRELHWNFVAHEIRESTDGGRIARRKRSSEGVEEEQGGRTKRARNLPAADRRKQIENLGTGNPRVALQPKPKRPTRTVGRGTTRAVNASVRVTAPPEDPPFAPTPASLSENGGSPGESVTAASGPRRTRRRIVSGSTETTETGTNVATRRSNRNRAVPDILVSDWVGPRRRR